MEQIKPITRQTLGQVVMDRLLDYLQSGPLQPGDVLPSQHELARRLGVSRPVLREAMLALSSLGVVDVRRGSGSYVGDPRGVGPAETLVEVVTHETALELLEARMVVEVELAGLAAERATDDDFARMEAILARLKRAIARGQPSAPVTSDFHVALARAGHNTVLARMARLLTRSRVAQGLRIEHALPDITSGELDSHRLLYDAVASRDPSRARAEMRRHLELAHGWEERVAALRRHLERANGSPLAASD